MTDTETAETAAECHTPTLCTAGGTQLKTATGLSFNIWSKKYSSPAIHLKFGNTICYVKLEQGEITNAIHLEYNGNVYHTIN